MLTRVSSTCFKKHCPANACGFGITMSQPERIDTCGHTAVYLPINAALFVTYPYQIQITRDTSDTSADVRFSIGLTVPHR